MLRLGEAAYDERGQVAYGEPGDQTGLEVRQLEFYNDVNRPWVKVFRAKDKDEQRKIGQAMREACENPNIGYAQYGDGSTPYKDRYGLRYAIDNDTPTHIIPDVKVPCNVDCSALVAQCCRAAGIDVPSTMRTATQEQILMPTGHFDELDYSDGMELLVGDIMWRNGHTAAVTEIGYSPTPKWVGKAVKACKVYTLPSTTSTPLKQWPALGVGNLVDVCDEDGRFWYVRIAGKYFGFVEKDCLENANPAPEPVPPVPVKIPFNGETTEKCTLRTGPGSNCVPCNIEKNDGKGIRNYLYEGEQVTVTAEMNGWYQVEIKGTQYTWYPWTEAKHIKEAEKKPEVGSKIKFVGKSLYTSAYGGTAVSVPNFNGVIVKIYDGLTHPYQVKADNNQYSGYADRKDFELV